MAPFFLMGLNLDNDNCLVLWYSVPEKLLEEVWILDAFVMEIAGVPIGIRPLFQSTREYCGAFLTQREPELWVELSPEELADEQRLLDREAVEQGLRFRKFSEPFLERSVMQRRIADYLVGHNTLMLHGSAVAVDGQGYLFTAPCGTGKSTHTRLWRELFGRRAVMINDDKPFLQVTPTGVLAYGSPWSGKHGLASNICVPLKGICSLARGKENEIRPARAEELMELLRRQIHLPGEENLRAEQLLAQVTRLVPLWTMLCNKDPSAAQVAFDRMHRS